MVSECWCVKMGGGGDGLGVGTFSPAQLAMDVKDRREAEIGQASGRMSGRYI